MTPKQTRIRKWSGGHLALGEDGVKGRSDVLDVEVGAGGLAGAVDGEHLAALGQQSELGDQLFRELMRAIHVVAAAAYYLSGMLLEQNNVVRFHRIATS